MLPVVVYLFIKEKIRTTLPVLYCLEFLTTAMLFLWL